MSSSHRIFFAIGIIAMVTSVTVMGVVGVWSALLPPPPSFFCLDDCTGLYLEQRDHYYRVTAWALVTASAAWVAFFFSIPAGLAPPSQPRRALRAPLAFGAVLSVGALGVLQSVSFPIAAAMGMLGTTVLLFWGWMLVRRWVDSGRLAAVAAIVLLVLMGSVAVYPMSMLVVSLSDVLTAREQDAPRWETVMGIPMALAVGCVLYGIFELRKQGGLRTRLRPGTPREAVVLLPVISIAMFIGVLAAWPVQGPAPEELAGPRAVSLEPGDGALSHPLPIVPSPTATPPAPPGPAAVDLPACTAADLRVEAAGWNGASGKSMGFVRAENVGGTDCALRGAPGLQIMQRGDSIDLRIEPMTSAPTVPQPLGGVGLRPGDTASASLFWPGYRSAADQETRQEAFLDLKSEEDVSVPLIPIDLLEESAPFDLKDGVDGGAVIEIGHWVPDSE